MRTNRLSLVPLCMSACLAGATFASAALGQATPPAPVYLSPLLPQANPTIVLPKGATEVGFIRDVLEQIPSFQVFQLTQFPMPNGTVVDLELSEFDVRTEDFRANIMKLDADGNTVIDPTAQINVRTFRGKVAGQPDSLVYLAFGDRMVSGFITLYGRTFSISNGRSGTMPVVISDMNALPEGAINWTQYECGTLEGEHGKGASTETGEGGIAALSTCKRIDLAFETDNEFRGLFDSNADALEYLVQIAAGINVIYFADQNVYPVLDYTRVWDTGTSDPWTSGDMCGQLDQFTTSWEGSGRPADLPAAEYALAHIISGRNLGGGCAWLSGVCNGNRYACSGNINGFFPFPIQNGNNQNWDIVVTAHEMGHNCACNHTHDLGVDGCGNGNCSGANQGTIMSYCHLCPGGLGNIQLNFAQANNVQMDGFLGGVSCGGTGACPLEDPQNLQATDGLIGSSIRLTWAPPTIAGLGYSVQRKIASEADSTYADLTTINGNFPAEFQDPAFPGQLVYLDTTASPGIVYRYRVRSLLTGGGFGTQPPDDLGSIGFLGAQNVVASDGLFSDSIRVTWTAPTTIPEASWPQLYMVMRSTLGGSFQYLGAVRATAGQTEFTFADNGAYEPPVKCWADPTPPAGQTDPTPDPAANQPELTCAAPATAALRENAFYCVVGDSFADSGYAGYSSVVFAQFMALCDAVTNAGTGFMPVYFENYVLPDETVPGVQYRYQVVGVRYVAPTAPATTPRINALAAPVSDLGTRALPEPIGFSATGEIGGSTQPLTDRIRLVWSPQFTGAPMSSFQVFRAQVIDGAETSYTEIAQIPGNLTTWSDFDVLDEVAYVYQIRGTNSIAGLTAPSVPDVGFKLQAPTLVSTTDALSGSVRVQWSAPNRWIPVHYSLWRKVQGAPSTDWGKIQEVLTASSAGVTFANGVFTYSDTSAVPGVVYNYAVSARSGPAGLNSDSYRSNVKNGYAAPAAPVMTGASDGTYAGYIRIDWQAPPNANGAQLQYRVQRKRAGTTQNWQTIATVSSLFYLDSNAAAGPVFQYRIRAVLTNGAVSAASAVDSGYKFTQND